MPQVYRPRANIFSKVAIFGSFFFLAGLAWVLTLFFRSSYMTREGVPIKQPVPFPHELHVRGLGVDCRFCHVSVEESSFADYPPTHTCMTCHSQVKTFSPGLVLVRNSWRSGRAIGWNRVNDLADFTYFNHAIHVKQGVACETCHGRVDQMGFVQKTETLYMEWCLECHRHPEDFIRPRQEVFTMGWPLPADQPLLGSRLVAEYGIASADQLDDCSICHY